MEIKINNDLLQECLAYVGSIIPKNPTHPILGFLYGCFKSDTLILKGFDLSLGIEISIPIEIINSQNNDEFSFVADIKFLTNLVKKIPQKTLLIKVDLEKNIFNIAIESGSLQMRVFDATEYPAFGVRETKSDITLNSIVLWDLIDFCVPAAAKDESKAVLTGVHFDFNEDNVTAVATNGHICGVGKVRWLSETEKVSGIKIVIPAKTLASLKRMISLEDEELKIVLSNSDIEFHFKNDDVKFVLYSRIIDDYYPNVESLFPNDIYLDIAVLKKDLQSAINVISIYSDQKIIFRLSPQKDIITLSPPETELGDGYQSIKGVYKSSTEIENDPQHHNYILWVNPQYLKNILQAFEDEELSILIPFNSKKENISSLERPITIKTKNTGNELKYLLVPIRATS